MTFFTDSTFIGIDPTAGQRPFVYAALDTKLDLFALGHGEINDVLAFVAGQQKALVAVCSPRRPNQGLMQKPEVRDQISPPPRPGRWQKYRVSEYLLRQHNIHTPRTPARVKNCPNWMRMGFTLYQRLEDLGYHSFPTSEANHQTLEVYPHACYTVMLGQAPFQKQTIEGRIQRQLILYEQKVGIPDPMRIFEEITRHRLLNGILALDKLYTPGELDALVAAYTACLAASAPDRIVTLGALEEGLVYLPVGELRARY
jgi:hypothetical protein